MAKQQSIFRMDLPAIFPRDLKHFKRIQKRPDSSQAGGEGMVQDNPHKQMTEILLTR